MHRNKIAASFEKNMTDDEISRAFDINFHKPGMDRPTVHSDHVPMNIEKLTSNSLALCVEYKRHSKKAGSAPSVGSKIYMKGLHAWNDPLAIAEEKTSEGMALEETVGVIVKASDLLSRANAMIKATKPLSRAPNAKRPPAARKTAGGKKKPWKIA